MENSSILPNQTFLSIQQFFIFPSILAGSKLKRKIGLGHITEEHLGRELRLNGWVQSIRRAGQNLFFIVLRESCWITIQLLFNSSNFENWEAVRNTLESLGEEYVVSVRGILRERPKEMHADEHHGQYEIEVKEMTVLNRADPLPFDPHHEPLPSEDIRLKYRYIDLRGKGMHQNIELRSKVNHKIRHVLEKKGRHLTTSN